MTKIEEQEFICLDCETTGLDPLNDRVIEVALVRFTLNEVLEEFETLINPDCIIPESSIVFHHITQDMVQGKPTIQQVLPKLLSFFDRKHIIVGHGIQFDIQLLINAAERFGIPCQLKANRSLDTLRMARLYGESPVNSLEQLRKHFNIPLEGAHRAMNDVIVNTEVFKQLLKRYKTIEQLFAALSKPILFKIMPLGKHKGRALKDVPLDYLLWAARQEFDQDLLYSLRSEVNRRKKGDSFNQVGNPFNAL